MKRSLIFIFPILLILAAFEPQKLQLPPIPQEDPQTEKIAIVLTKQKPNEQDINNQLKQLKNTKLRRIFTHAINGFSVKGPVSELEKLKKSTDIQFLSEVNTYKVENSAHLPNRYKPSDSFIDNFELIGTDAVHGILDEKGNRLTGRGVTIGVIDTGIDYDHPDLRRSFAGGHDLVDGDDDPMETKGAGFRSTLHGTHVAGVIAANGRMRGIAPDAKLVAYRALGPGGSGTTEQVIAAIDEAIKDKVDILNLSLGNDVNGPDLPISLALNKAVDEGIVAVTSSGNSGPNRWTVGSPGTASKAISVGASTPPMQVPYLDATGLSNKIRLELLQGSDNWNITQSENLVFAGLGTKEEMKDVRDKLVLVERGKLTFTEKAKNAYEAGAIGVIIYNNTKGTFFGNLEESMPIPVAAISKEAGLALKKQLDKNSTLIRINLIEEKDILADFSSRGPVTVTWEIKPDIVAPGVAINSTIPGGYLPLQGTSMAAPHVAGAAALIKQAHPDWTPAEIKAAIMNTAKDITNRNGKRYRTFEQGAGRIQLEAAINSETLVSPGSLQFGKFQLADSMHEHSAKLTVKNTGTSTRTYSFSIPKKEQGIDWELPMSFTLEPKETKDVELAMVASPSLLKEKIHDGALIIDDGKNKISIPYLYVVEEPDYPRVMGFDFAPADNGEAYRYEVYLPGGAEEFGIALFDPDQYRFVGFLDWGRKLEKGMVGKEIPLKNLPEEGMYLAKVFARKQGKESTIDTMIFISKNVRGEERD
ncbi:S8 family serine peptidase [Mesobacillus jeotgali]|uniref:S8 family serine peptidase n=1 Tax=Mesobacillus jeotgali TaxID=129985 RepID=A0ABY9VMW5_9BACI|nr:S8 family serine peptidase [Mesobacillus jeotgali]WNF25294.1 S8 family serine peptidase [Mesobacillus jeotgali]